MATPKPLFVGPSGALFTPSGPQSMGVAGGNAAATTSPDVGPSQTSRPPRFAGRYDAVGKHVTVPSGIVSGKLTVQSQTWGDAVGNDSTPSGRIKAAVSTSMADLLAGTLPSMQLVWRHAVKQQTASLSDSLDKRSNWDRQLEVNKGQWRASVASAGIKFRAHKMDASPDAGLLAALSAVTLDVGTTVDLLPRGRRCSAEDDGPSTAAARSLAAVREAQAQERRSWLSKAVSRACHALGLDAPLDTVTYPPCLDTDVAVSRLDARLSTTVRAYAGSGVHLGLTATAKSAMPEQGVATGAARRRRRPTVAFERPGDGGGDGDGDGASWDDGDHVSAAGAGLAGLATPWRSDAADRAVTRPRQPALAAASSTKRRASHRLAVEAAAMWLRGPYEATAEALLYSTSASPQLQLTVFSRMWAPLKLGVRATLPLPDMTLRGAATRVCGAYSLTKHATLYGGYTPKSRTASLVYVWSGPVFSPPATVATPRSSSLSSSSLLLSSSSSSSSRSAAPFTSQADAAAAAVGSPFWRRAEPKTTAQRAAELLVPSVEAAEAAERQARLAQHLTDHPPVLITNKEQLPCPRSAPAASSAATSSGSQGQSKDKAKAKSNSTAKGKGKGKSKGKGKGKSKVSATQAKGDKGARRGPTATVKIAVETNPWQVLDTPVTRAGLWVALRL